MDTKEKIETLLDHWIEHNASHGEEFGKWAQRATEAGLSEVSGDIRAAASKLQEATDCLNKALARLRADAS